MSGHNFRSRPVGWRGESYRHYLAGKGVSSSVRAKNRGVLRRNGFVESEVSQLFVDRRDGSLIAVARKNLVDSFAVPDAKIRSVASSSGENNIVRIKSENFKNYFSLVDDIIVSQDDFMKHDSVAVGSDGDIDSVELLKEYRRFKGQLEAVDVSSLSSSDRVKLRKRIDYIDGLIADVEFIDGFEDEFSDYVSSFKERVGAQERVAAVKRVDGRPSDAFFDEGEGKYFVRKGVFW